MKKCIMECGYPPTVREICSELNVKSTSTIHKDLSSLENKGFIKKNPSKPRAIVVVGFDRFGENDEVADYQIRNARRDIVDVPLIGQVAAGIPILAEQNILDTFPVPAKYINTSGDHFMLTVKGDSMIEAGICDGDYILVQQQETANNGDMVVAMIDGFESEATVKTFYREGDSVRLQPENSSMSPIIVRDVKILVRVRGVFRYFN